MNADDVHVATPAAIAAFVQTGLPSMLNVTVPVGVPDPGATDETVAVNVTDWPVTDGFTDDATDVEVDAAFTTCPPASVPVDAFEFASPLYVTDTG